MEGRNRGEYVVFAATLSLEIDACAPGRAAISEKPVAEKPA
jgi:hypothetical protein